MNESVAKRPVPSLNYLSCDSHHLFRQKCRTQPRLRRPHAPPKSLPPPSGYRRERWRDLKPHQVSFTKSNDEVDLCTSSPHYNADSEKSFLDQCYYVERKLGEGSFGEVFRVQSKDSGELFAVKRSRETYRGPMDRADKLKEVQKLEQLPPHRNLVRFIQAWEERGGLFIQTELCKCSLQDYAIAHPKIAERQLWYFLIDLLQGVEFLHSHDVLHMDIKPENIFLTDDGICKLGDLGLVIDLRKGIPAHPLDGDAKYLAPEVLAGNIGKHSDIFSLGISMLELASDLDVPTYGDGWQLLREGVLPDEFLHGLSPEMVKIIRLMTLPAYQKRPTAAQLLQHPTVRRHAFFRHFFYAYRDVVNRTKRLLVMVWFSLRTFVTALFSILGIGLKAGSGSTGGTGSRSPPSGSYVPWQAPMSPDAPSKSFLERLRELFWSKDVKANDSAESGSIEDDRKEFFKCFEETPYGSKKDSHVRFRQTPLNSTPSRSEATPSAARDPLSTAKRKYNDSVVSDISGIYCTPNSTFTRQNSWDRDEEEEQDQEDDEYTESVFSVRPKKLFYELDADDAEDDY